MLDKFTDRIVTLMAVLAGLILVFITCLIFVDIVNRTMKLLQLSWSVNLAEHLLFVMTFMGAPWVLRIGGHISLDLFVQLLPDAVRKPVTWLAFLMSALVNLILFYYAMRVLLASYRDGTNIVKALVFPEWYLMWVAPLCFAVNLLVLIQLLRQSEKRQFQMTGL